LIYESVKGGMLELENGGVNFRRPDSNEVIRDIVGIMLDPPFVSNMDAFYDALYYMENEKPVLVIFLDGFSYDQYQALCLNHPDSYLAGLPAFKRATSVYRPVTNAGFAAMVTGQPPAVNGIHDRSGRELACDSIFDLAKA
jgi:predicted AlkP superfamily pyrophosphatase or phosphodiesterase